MKNCSVIGFCGVDDSVSVEHLYLLSSTYPWIEWGILFRSDLEGTSRYASSEWILKLVEYNHSKGQTMDLAGHLCGDRCVQITNGDNSFVHDLYSKGFRRVQINATVANGVILDNMEMNVVIQNIVKCIQSVPDMEWIIQANDETKPIWKELVQISEASMTLKNMSLLYDASCGRGVEVTSFPSPLIHPTIRCGYAGGIGPQNIFLILQNIQIVLEGCNDKMISPVWIDMESSLRILMTDKDVTNKDVFSIEKCFKCIIEAAKFDMNN